MPAEMAFPLVASRIEQRDKFRSRPVPLQAGYVRPFVSVAVQASVREVAQESATAVLLRDDVFDFKRNRMDTSR
jgi:hypothetical protein